MSAISSSTESATAFPANAQCARLPALQVIELSGADALTFLHGQLTQDVQGLTDDAARLAAYCSAKGRMLASMVIWRAQAADGTATIRALVDASVAQALIKRLRMFVLRAKVTIEALDLTVSGVWADDAATRDTLAVWAGDIPSEPWRLSAARTGLWIAAPHAGAGSPAGRWWHIADDAGALPCPEAADLEETWRRQDILAGLAWITQPTQDLVTPLVANFDLIGGVSFTKGCYPGQEVVARSHYLGKQKRRTMMAHADALPDDVQTVDALVGTDVYQAQSTGEPLGRVINAAAGPNGPYVLFEAPVAVATTADLTLGSPDGPKLAVQPLPYSVAAQS